MPLTGLVDLDRWALARTRELQDEVIAAYRSYDFHLIYQKVHNFCVVDMGGFYLDVIKDRLYTTPPRGLPRRSAQTAMYHVLEAMVRWLAPDPLVHRRGDLAAHAGRAPGVGIPVNVGRTAGRRDGATPPWTGRRCSGSARRCCASSSSCGSQARSARRSTPSWTSMRRPGSGLRWRPSARSCGSC